MKCTSNEIIKLATEELGTKEKKSDSGYESKTENAGHANWNKYAHYIDEKYPTFYNGRKNGYAWCDIFVDYLFLFCFGLDNALRLLCQPLKSAGAGCTYSRNYYKKAGRYGKEPKVGSQIMFTNDKGKTCCHTGIVIAIAGKNVITIEGNSGDEVRQRTYNINDTSIDGYGYPMYDEVKETNQEGVKVKTEYEIAQEVIKGLWGNGKDREDKITRAGYNYSNIQALVNKIVKGEDVEKEDTKGDEVLTVNVEKNKYKQIIINLV